MQINEVADSEIFAVRNLVLSWGKIFTNSTFINEILL